MAYARGNQYGAAGKIQYWLEQAEYELNKTIDATLAAYVRDVRMRIPVARAYVYGSYACGELRPDSDVDVAIFSDFFNNKNLVEATTFLLGMSRRYSEVCIEPIGFSATDLNADTPFIKTIIATGREIATT